MPVTHKRIKGQTKRFPRRSNNPTEIGTNSYKRAVELSERFHGRKASEVTHINETEVYPSNLAKLGDLVELQILMEDEKTVLPIDFKGCDVNVCANPGATQIYFVGGDQDLDIDEILDGVDEGVKGKRFLLVGPVHSITYWTDKHHLEGPKYQKTGSEYEHMFGEEGGEMPQLVFDMLNKKIMLVGGSYEIEDEGIRN